MEEELFLLSDKDKVVKALGLKVHCQPKDVRIFVNGRDLTRNLVIEEIRIVIDKGEGD